MRYLDALNEANKENKTKKNKAMNRPTEPTDKPGKHSTDGSERNRRERPAQRVRNVKIRPGETRDVITKGRTGRVTAAGRLVGPMNRPTADLSVRLNTPDTKPNIPGPKPGEKPKLNVSHTEYKRMGLLMAESLGYEIDEVLNVVFQGARALGTGIARGVGAAARGVGNFVTGAATKKAKEKAMEKAMEKGEDVVKKVTGRRDDGNGVGRKRVGDMDHSQMGQSQMESYKQIGRMISEVLSPEKHAKETGGGKEAANRRYRRIRAVLRGKRISPIAGVEAVDKRGVTFSRAAKEYRAARDSGDSERPRDLKPSYSK